VSIGTRAGTRVPVTTLTLHATGPIAPAEAWDRYLHPGRWSSWAPQILGVETDTERIAQGVTGRVRGPLGVTVPFVVDEVDDASRRWRWTVQVGPARMSLLHWVTSGPDGGTTTGLRVRGPLPLAAGYAPAALVALHGLVRS
jgi:Polyketide cyclase / dehydrase and lipid transport